MQDVNQNFLLHFIANFMGCTHQNVYVSQDSEQDLIQFKHDGTCVSSFSTNPDMYIHWGHIVCSTNDYVVHAFREKWTSSSLRQKNHMCIFNATGLTRVIKCTSKSTRSTHPTISIWPRSHLNRSKQRIIKFQFVVRYTHASHFGTGRQLPSVDKPYIIAKEIETDVKSE